MRGYLLKLGNKASNGEQFITVEGNLTIATCSDFRRDLLQALESNSSIRIVAQNIEDIDLAGIQVLLSAVNMGKRLGRAVSIQTSFSQETDRILGCAGLLTKIGG
jgi:anti-anti-sigma regulatory factor